MLLAIALLVFISTVGLTVGVWSSVAGRRTIRQRLPPTPPPPADGSALLRDDRRGEERHPSRRGRVPGYDVLVRLIEQSGRPLRPASVAGVAGACAVVGGVIAAARTGSSLMVIVCAALGACVPFLFLAYTRHRRLKAFEPQL